MSPNIQTTTSFIFPSTSNANANSLNNPCTDPVLFGNFSKVELEKMIIEETKTEENLEEDYNFIADEERYVLSKKNRQYIDSICSRLESIVFGDFETITIPPTPPSSPTKSNIAYDSYCKNNKNSETLQTFNSMSKDNLERYNEIVFSKRELMEWANYERVAINRINRNSYKNYVKYINPNELYEIDLHLHSIYYTTYAMIYDIR